MSCDYFRGRGCRFGFERWRGDRAVFRISFCTCVFFRSKVFFCFLFDRWRFEKLCEVILSLCSLGK